jgi:hypothetical protein
LGGTSCQGPSAAEGGGRRPVFTGLATSHTRPPRSTAGNINSAGCLKTGPQYIAVLYTTYLPLPTNSWYNSYIKPFQPNIGPNLQSCASPGLYFQVSTDQDISGALAQLFNIAVETAHLTK